MRTDEASQDQACWPPHQVDKESEASQAEVAIPASSLEALVGLLDDNEGASFELPLRVETCQVSGRSSLCMSIFYLADSADL